MTRLELWNRLKASGITRSVRPECPSDSELRVVIAHTTSSAKALLDMLCSLDK